jgi:hypothetical protein
MAKKNCVSIASKEFKALQEEVKINPYILAAKIKTFQEINDTDKYPEAIDLVFISEEQESSDILPTSETVYYGGIKSLPIEEKVYKRKLSINMLKYTSKDRDLVTSVKYKGSRWVKHTKRSDSKSQRESVKNKMDNVKYNYERLLEINDNHLMEGEVPFIIKNVGKTDEGVPNYTIEVNEAWSEVNWENTKDELEVIAALDEEFYTPPIYASRKEGVEVLDDEEDTLDSFNDKIELMKKSFPGVTVTIDGDMSESGRYYPKGRDGKGDTEIVLNSKLMSKDVAIHEFGHLFIDLLGGMNNSFVKRGRDLLRGSDIERSVKEAYPELSGEDLDKEILTTAIGKEGASLFEEKQLSPIRTWIKIFLNKLRLQFGFNGNVALELSNRMLNNEINQDELTGQVSDSMMMSKLGADKESMSKEDANLNRSIEKITSRITSLKDRYEKSGKVNKEFKETIRSLLKELEGKQNIKGVIRYVDEMSSQTAGALSALNKMKLQEDVDIERLMQIESFVGAFSLTKEIKAMINLELAKDEDSRDKDVNELISKKKDLNESIQNISDINDAYLYLQDKALTKQLEPRVTRIKSAYRDQYERDFYAIHGGAKHARQSLSNFEDARSEHINNKLAENEDAIKTETDEYVKRILSMAPKDIGRFASWVIDPKSIDDVLIQTTIEILDRADRNSRKDFLNERDIARSIWQELRDSKGGTSDQKELYEDIIEVVDGKETNHLVGKYKSTYRKLISEQKEKWDKISDEGGLVKALDKINFYKQHQKSQLNPQWVKLQKMDNNNPTKKAYLYLVDQAARKDAITPDFYNLSLGIRVNNENLRNRSSFIKEIQKTLELDEEEGEITGELDKNTLLKIDEYNDNARKTSQPEIKISGIMDENTYSLPSIEKTTLERLGEQGVWTATREGFNDIFKKDTEFTEQGEQGKDEVSNKNTKVVNVDEKSKENQKVPIHYRNNLEKEGNQSFDLIGISLMDYNNVSNYKSKTSVSHVVELINDKAKTRTYVKRQGGKTLIQRIGTDKYAPVSEEGVDANVYKVLNSIVQDRLYGISSIDAGTFAGFNVNKISNFAMGWTGHTMLIANYMSGAVNLMQGKFQNYLEGAGGTIYNGKNLLNAEGLYRDDLNDIVKDIHAEVPKSMTNRLIEELNAFGDFSGIVNRYSNDNKLKRSGLATGHALNHMGEHYIQATLMYSVMDATKVKNAKGEMIPLHEAYEIVDDKLQLKKGVEFSEDDALRVERKIREVIKQIHGNYDNNNKAMAQRYAVGKLTVMLRKWMVVGVQRRWRGSAEALKKEDNRSSDDRAYDAILEQDAEGYYSTAIKFMIDLTKDIKTLEFKSMSGEWNKLTDLERGNIRKTLIEASTMVVTYTLGVVLAGIGEDADDEDKEAYYTMAYMSRRFYSELHFYSNPMESLKILGDPSTTVSMAKRFFDFTEQLILNPTERYSRGDSEGNLKIIKKIGMMTPGYSQLNRNNQESYEWLE